MHKWLPLCRSICQNKNLLGCYLFAKILLSFMAGLDTIAEVHYQSILSWETTFLPPLLLMD